MDSGNAILRVRVNNDGTSWSYIGKGVQSISDQSQPTINFGWFTDSTVDDEFSRVVTHEFGHAIGCIHEQSSPTANIPWNKPYVYAWYLQNLGWNQQQVDSQVFAVADSNDTIETPFDRTSIMYQAPSPSNTENPTKNYAREYAYSAEFTTDGSSAPTNTHLSDEDKKFIMQCYPPNGPRRTTADGCYFVNCFKGSDRSSGIAWYKFLGNNDGHQPDAYIDVSKGSNIIWESSGSGTCRQYRLEKKFFF